MSDDGLDRVSDARRGTRALRWLFRSVSLIVLVVALVAAGGYAVLASQMGVDWLSHELALRSGGALEIEGATGTLIGSVEARRITWRGATGTVIATDVALTWRPAALLSGAIVVDALGARELRMAFEPSEGAVPPPSSLALPVDVRIERAAVGTLEWQVGTSHGKARDLAFGYAGGTATHRISRLSVALPFGTLGGDAALDANAPFAIDGRFVIQGDAATKEAHLDVVAKGPLAALAVELDGRVGEGRVNAQARLAPLAAVPLVELAVAAQDVDLARWDRKLPATRIAVEARAQPAGGGLAGTFAATNALAGLIDAGRIPVRVLSASFAWRNDAIDLTELAAELSGGGKATGRAKIPLGRATAGNWTLDVRDLDPSQLYAPLVATRLAGRIDADLDVKRTTVRGEIANRKIAGGIGLEFVVAVADRVVDVERLRARAGGGELTAQGRVALDGERALSLDGTATRLDPSRFGAYPVGRLDGSLKASGVLSPAWRVRADLEFAPPSRLAGVALSGVAHGTATASTLRDAAIDVRIGSATLVATGSVGDAGDRFTATLDAPRVADLVPLSPAFVPRTLAGALHVKAEMAGTPPVAGLDVTVTGDDLRIRPSLAFGKFAASISIAPSTAVDGRADLASRGVRIAIDATDVKTPSGAFASAHAGVSGTLAAHTAAVALAGTDLTLDATAHGSVRLPPDQAAASTLAWSGTLDTFATREPWSSRLASPATLSFARGHVKLGEAHIVVADGNVHVDELAWDDGQIATHGHFAALPIATVARLLGRPLPLESTLTLGGEWSFAAAPRLNGTFSVRRENGDLWLVGDGASAATNIAAGITTLEAAVHADNDAIAATATVRSTRGGSADATLSIGTVADSLPGRIAPDAPVAATLKAELSTLQLLQPWAGTTAVIDGRAHVDLAARGTLSDASLSGTFEGTGLRVDAPQYGLHFADGRVSAHVAEHRVMLDELSLTAGGGAFHASGTLAAAGDNANAAAGHLDWRADKFRVFNRPDLHLIVSGSGEVTLAAGKFTLTGSLKADQGRFTYDYDPAASLGDDVVVKGWPRRSPDALRSADIPLAIDVNLDFGDRLTFTGKGLDTTLRGDIRVRNGPGGFTGKGSIRTVNGTYFAYGQKLVIDPGRLIFDGPLDNPGLDIVALRKNLAVEAGVAVTGTVKVPIVALTSNPPVPDHEKLSWLVVGQSLDRGSGTDLAALQAASAALLGPNSKPVTTTIAQSMGLDDISFKSGSSTPRGAAPGTSTAQGQVVAIGKRLTENLSVAYEQGLTVATNALRIEYNLTGTLSLRAEAGTLSSVGIVYRRNFE
jgi:translocation and assembly module TamB